MCETGCIRFEWWCVFFAPAGRRGGGLEQAISGAITIIGFPLILASIGFILAAYLEREIGIGPIKAPAPGPQQRSRWMVAGAVLGIVGLALVAGGTAALVAAADEDEDENDGSAAAAPTEFAPSTVPPGASATATPRTAVTPTAAPVTLLNLVGSWRSRQASEGDLLLLTVTVTDAVNARIEGAYQARLGVIQLTARGATFADGTLKSTEQWPLGTSVDRLRLSSARLSNGQLQVEIEHCVVGQLGTNCTTRTNTLVR